MVGGLDGYADYHTSHRSPRRPGLLEGRLVGFRHRPGERRAGRVGQPGRGAQLVDAPGRPCPPVTTGPRRAGYRRRHRRVPAGVTAVPHGGAAEVHRRRHHLGTGGDASSLADRLPHTAWSRAPDGALLVWFTNDGSPPTCAARTTGIVHAGPRVRRPPGGAIVRCPTAISRSAPSRPFSRRRRPGPNAVRAMGQRDRN